jgi:excisionase family DNA binding protein
MELWTLKETAKYTRMSLAFWRKQLWLRTIPAIKIGRAVRLDADTVRAFLEARTRPAQTRRG